MFKDADGMILCPRKGLWEQKKGNHGGCKEVEKGEQDEIQNT